MPANATQPKRSAMFMRSLRRRCPVCASKKISRHPAHIHAICPNCGLTLERQDGSFIGGVGINTVVSFFVLLIVVVAGFGFTKGDRSLAWVLLPALGTALFVPLYFYARSRLLWLCVELAITPLKPGETTVVR